MSWLDHKYINQVSHRLQKFKQTSRLVWTFRCPYCGDSEKKKTKRRGYFYNSKDTLFYKCHNCGESKPFKYFLQDNFPEVFREYLFEEFGGERKPKEVEEVNPGFLTKGLAGKFKRSGLLDNFDTLADCDEDNPGRAYIEGRKIPAKFLKMLYWTDDVNKLFKRIPAYEDRVFSKKFGAVIIPYFSEKQSGKTLMYAQLRFIADDAPGRYMTLEVEGGRKIWGLDRVDLDEDIYVFEGAFDAMFVPNAISVGGADIIDAVEWLMTKTKSKISIVWDTDYADNKEVRARLNEAVRRGFNVTLTDKKDLHGKDVNDAIKDGGKTRAEVVDIIKKKTFSGLDAQLELAKIKKPTKQNQKGANGYKKKIKDFPEI